MNDPTQEYFDVQISFSHGDPMQVFQLLSEVTKLYGYEVRKTISRPNQTVSTKALVRFHQSITIGSSCVNKIEASVRKFIDVLSIEMERIDESAMCWWTKITPVEYEVLVSSMD